MDGVNQTTNSFLGPNNHWNLCDNTTLTDGTHSLILQIVVPEGQQFWFDYMQYAPSENVPLDNANVYIDNTDPDITYGEGWTTSSGIGEEALTSGTALNLKFHGMLPMSIAIFVPLELTTLQGAQSSGLELSL